MIIFVISVTVNKIGDRAFYRCSNLQNAVFLGDEPLETGENLFAEVSPAFTLHYMTERNWNANSKLLTSNVCRESTYRDILICESGLFLSRDDTYGVENQYSGNDLRVSVISPDTNAPRTCFLAVYDENGTMISVDVQSIELSRYMNEITFHDVNIQYIGEEFCQIGVFVTDDSLTPTTSAVKKIMFKPS